MIRVVVNGDPLLTVDVPFWGALLQQEAVPALLGWAPGNVRLVSDGLSGTILNTDTGASATVEGVPLSADLINPPHGQTIRG